MPVHSERLVSARPLRAPAVTSALPRARSRSPKRKAPQASPSPEAEDPRGREPGTARVSAACYARTHGCDGSLRALPRLST